MDKKSFSLTLIERTWIGIKKGWNTPTLPKEMLDFQMKPLIRILRVVGGISFISILGHDHIHLQGFMLYTALFFNLIFLIYHIYISIHRFKYMCKILKSNELDVRKSDLDNKNVK